MAVTQKSDGNSKKTVEEGAEPSCREGPSTGPRDIKKDASGIIKSYNPRRNRNKDNKSESLFDIDDAEVCGYLNTKEEIHWKRILWEAMNGKCTKAKKQKRTIEKKKGVKAKQPAKTTEKSEFEISQRRSSKINYDALKLLNDELEQNSETA